MFAFPSPHDPKTGTMQFGMELRDYFAARAMQHWLSLPIDENQCERVAVEAYKVADAMMKARDE